MAKITISNLFPVYFATSTSNVVPRMPMMDVGVFTSKWESPTNFSAFTKTPPTAMSKSVLSVWDVPSCRNVFIRHPRLRPIGHAACGFRLTACRNDPVDAGRYGGLVRQGG